MLRNWLAALMAALFLIACGGGESIDSSAEVSAAPSMHPFGDFSTAVNAGKKLDGTPLTETRKRALAATDTCTVSADELLNWAEGLKLTAFFKGPVTARAPYLGVTYDFRFYPGAGMGNYLGVVVSGGPVGGVFGLGTFTGGQLMQFGNLSDYVRDIKGDCTGTAGTLSLSDADKRLTPVFTVNGEMTYVGAADNAIYKPKVSDIDQVCWNSQRLGWGKFNATTKPRGCTQPQADGTLKFAGMCSNDAGLPTLWTKDGKELWPDFGNAKGWKLAGDLNPQKATIPGDGFLIAYGKNGYQPATLSYQGGTLTMNFASDCFGGSSFSKPIEAGDLEFRWNSDVEGWLAQSKKRSVLSWDAAVQKFREVVTFTGLACGQRGTITVHKPKSKSGNSIVWDDEPYAWFSIPEQGNLNPFWKNGPGIDWFHQVLIGHQEHAAMLKC